MGYDYHEKYVGIQQVILRKYIGIEQVAHRDYFG